MAAISSPDPPALLGFDRTSALLISALFLTLPSPKNAWTDTCETLKFTFLPAGRYSVPIASISARALPPSRSDHLLIPSQPLHWLRYFCETQDDHIESLAKPIACGYLLGNLEDGVSVKGNLGGNGFFGASSGGDDWPATMRVALISHFASRADDVNRPALLKEDGSHASLLLESILEGFQALSWLNTTDGGCRTSVLPMHAAMAERMRQSVED
jgi:hypothetical protein